MKKSFKFQLSGSIIFFLSIILAWIFFGWQLSLIIWLALTGNNLERHGNRLQKEEIDELFKTEEVEKLIKKMKNN